jgi:ubiquinone/menaquinone biosynthesis C-methylase UbiE
MENIPSWQYDESNHLGDNVLEIGAGTGERVLAAAKHCRKVIAVDTSSGMLRLAENKARSMGIKNVEFVQSGFLTYDGEEPVDVAVSYLR